MCKNQYTATRMVGYDCDVTNAATGEEETTLTLSASDGDIIGFSVAENYSRTVLAKMLISISLGNNKPLLNVPLTQLLPDGERQMWPLNERITAGSKPVVKLVIRDNTTDVNNPVVLIGHHEVVNSSCKK